MDTRLADEGAVTGEGLNEVERFEGVRGKAVVLGAVLIEGADEPVASEPLHAQSPSGAVGDGFADEAKLVQVVVDLLVEAFGGNGALVTGERRPEDREHQAAPICDRAGAGSASRRHHERGRARRRCRSRRPLPGARPLRR